jgi:serine protease Do
MTDPQTDRPSDLPADSPAAPEDAATVPTQPTLPATSEASVSEATPMAPAPTAWSSEPAAPSPTPAGWPSEPAPRQPSPVAWSSEPASPAAAPASPADAPASPSRYSPAPEPRPDWSRPEYGGPVWSTPPEPATSSWYQPAAPVAPAPPAPRRAVGIGTVLGASILAAVIASGGTFVALDASGALDRTTTLATTPAGVPAGTKTPVTVNEQSSIIDVAAKVGPAVVQIDTTDATGGQNDPFGNGQTGGVGSGIIYDSNGWILTNKHVVTGAKSLTVQLKDGRQFTGTVYGTDTLTDLAIVKIDATGLPTATMGDSDTLKVGELTIAIGSPLGTYSNSVTSGILSATGRSIQVDSGNLNNLLQTDTAINPGNSGGPLLDSAGDVIGINTAIASSAEGIGFAIPINLAKPVMAQAIAGEKLARPYIGIRFQTIDYQLAQSEKLPVQDGALIKDSTASDGTALPAVVSGGPADKAGIRSGDIITSIGGTKLDSEHPLDLVISQFSPGQTVTVGILRGGKAMELQVTLGTRPEGL